MAAALRRQNREERKGQTTLFADLAYDATPTYGSLAEGAARLDALPDDSPAAIHEKETRWRRLAASEDARRERLRADAWCAAFVWPKCERRAVPEAPTFDLFRKLSKDPAAVPSATRQEIERLAVEYRFFHWHLAFPDVFRVPEHAPADDDPTGWEDGFDVVLSNPPWERIKLQEKEFFATRHPEIANAPNAAARQRLIAKLAEEDPALHDAFLAARRQAEGESHLVRDSGRYPLCGRGDVNTYAVFAELMRGSVSATGRVGCIVPSGIATDDTTKHFFNHLSERGNLRNLYSFWEVRRLFPGADSRSSFCLLTISGIDQPGIEAEFAFDLRATSDLGNPERRFRLSAEDITLLNPNTRTCPIFRTRRDAELTKAIYRRVPILVREGPPEENAWRMSFMTMFHMANDSHIFRTREQLEPDGWRLEGNAFLRDGERQLPLYEAKMIHHFDHRFGDYDLRDPASQSTALPDVPTSQLADPSYSPRPRYWVAESEVEARLAGRRPHPWLLGWRDMCRSTDARTLIVSVLPPVGVGHKMPLFVAPDSSAPELAALYTSFASFALDFVARQKMGGTSLTYHYLKQFAVIVPDVYARPCLWESHKAVIDWLRPRVLELTYTAWDLAPFARDLGYDGPPFRWDQERRSLLRCELDAAFFHLYLGSPDEWRRTATPELRGGLPTPRDAVAHIMDTFPIVKRKDESTHGHYRTRDTILDIYDDLQRASDTGEAYQTRLDPPPADRRAAHTAPARATPPEPKRRLYRVPGDRDKRYIDRVPLLSVKAAAGAFSGGQEPAFQDWVHVEARLPLARGMFVAQVEGDSMEPLIPADAYCLFRRGAPRDYSGSVVLAQIRELGDPEEGGQYAVKRLTRGLGDATRLESENPDYPPIDLDPEETNLRVIATFVDVIGHEVE